MIIIQSPLRVSFFGGGTDLPSYYMNEGGCILSSAINKYIFVSVKTRFDQKVRVGYTRTELVNHVDDLQHDLIREALRMTGVSQGVEITTMGDIPSAGSGLGSSSTVTVGTLQALYAFCGEHVTAERLAREACQIEIDILGKPIGIQDQIIAAYGGIRFMEFKQDGRTMLDQVTLSSEAKRELNSNLMLFYTGITRRAETILSEQQMNIRHRLEILSEMKQLARLARVELESGNVDELGHMLHYGWTLKKKLASGISSSVIDEMYAAAREAGALGGKITGAGGGGFLLLYCTNDHQASVRSALRNLRELPFRLERDGAKTIFNYPRSENGLEDRRKRIHKSIDIHSGHSEGKGVGINMITSTASNTETKSLLRQYQRDFTRTVQDLPLEEIQAAVDILHTKRMSENRIFIMGNGGSASTASHFVCDLNKNMRHEGWPDFKAFGLADNMPVFSAYANDDGYENVFCRQLQNDLAQGDVVIGISASGNSENVVRGIRYARETGAYTIAFTGFDGGRLGGMVDLHIHISNHVIEQVEDIHLMLEHMIIRSMKLLPSTARIDASVRGQEVAVMRELSPMQVATSFDVDSNTAQEGETLSKVEWIYQLNRSLLDEESYDGLLKQVLKSAHGLLKADSGSVLSYDRDGKPIGGYTLYAGELVKRKREEVLEIGQNGLAKWVYDHRAPTLVEDTRDDARWIQGEGDTISRSAVCIPLVIRGDTVGVLSLARLRDKGYSEGHLTFLAAITYILSNESGRDLETSLQDLDHNDLPSVE